jgi:hypothetical protein
VSCCREVRRVSKQLVVKISLLPFVHKEVKERVEREIEEEEDQKRKGVEGTRRMVLSCLLLI